MRVAPARLAMGDVSRETAALPGAQSADRLLPALIDHRLHLLATAATRDLLVLGAQAAARPEERALHHGPRHPQPLADLRIGQTFELAQDDDLVVGLGQSSERSAKIIELLAALERSGRRTRSSFELALQAARLIV
jgi:hypothetical protein